jgi:uncharacterized protein YkwD
MTKMLRPARTVSALALVVVLAGGAVAAAGVGAVSRPADVSMRAVRVDVGELVQPTIVPTPVQSAAGALNAERAARGLPLLDWQDQVARAAQIHSDDMARSGVMQHAGSDGSRAGDRLTRVGFRWSAWGEAVAAGQPTPDDVIRAWLNSPPHRAILLGNYRYVGIGLATNAAGTPYWTLVAAS